MDYLTLIESTRDTLVQWANESDESGNVQVYDEYLRNLAENLTAALDEMRS